MTSTLVNQEFDSSKARAVIARAFRVRSRRAFSLVEVVLVVVIVGILAAIAVPRFANSNALYRAEIAAKRVEADIHLAQDLARSLSAQHNVNFRAGSTAYVVEPASTDATPLGAAQTGARVTDLDVAPFKSRVMKANFGGSTTLSFDAYGTPIAPGHVVVYANDWGALIRVGEGLGVVDITMFKVRTPPVAVTTEAGAMDLVTRTLSPTPTKALIDRTKSLGGEAVADALEVVTPGAGDEVAVDDVKVIGP